MISDLLQIEPSEYEHIRPMSSHFSSRLGYEDTLAILNHEFFELNDLNAIFQQRTIPSYIPPDPQLVSPFLDKSTPSPSLNLAKCLNFKDFLEENQDIFEGF